VRFHASVTVIDPATRGTLLKKVFCKWRDKCFEELLLRLARIDVRDLSFPQKATDEIREGATEYAMRRVVQESTFVSFLALLDF
jgi:hypothetical protein